MIALTVTYIPAMQINAPIMIVRKHSVVWNHFRRQPCVLSKTWYSSCKKKNPALRHYQHCNAAFKTRDQITYIPYVNHAAKREAAIPRTKSASGLFGYLGSECRSNDTYQIVEDGYSDCQDERGAIHQQDQ
jgi:hypothetical protein